MTTWVCRAEQFKMLLRCFSISQFDYLFLRLSNRLVINNIGNVAGIRSQRHDGIDGEISRHRKINNADVCTEIQTLIAEEDHEKSENNYALEIKKQQIFNDVLYARQRREAYFKYVGQYKIAKYNNKITELPISSVAEMLLNESNINQHQPNPETNQSESTTRNKRQEINENIPYPYAIHTPLKTEEKSLSDDNVKAITRRLKSLSSVHFNPETSDENDDFDLETLGSTRYGSADRNIPSSDVPCGGCGAFLHCQDTGLPGYIPSEIFRGASKPELRALICQRCHFLKDYNIALGVNISPDDYSKLLGEIKDKTALVILIVDLLDFPTSIWPGLIDIIGKNRPICVVGNKVDLLPKDRPGYLERIKQSLAQTLKDVGIDTGNNIKYVSLVSAKTGYGIEELITKLQTQWGLKGDVYLVGCTNVGKSSLFNSLIQSDFCKSQAVDIIQRSTVSPWPGTTLNLLKFPILNPTGKRLTKRVQRLMSEQKEKHDEEKLQKEIMKGTKNLKCATLISQVGFTFYQPEAFKSSENDPFLVKMTSNPEQTDDFRKTFNPKKPEFKDSKWCYDTPGSVQPNQIINILTLDELKYTLPKEIIRPRTFVVKPNYSLLLAGLGRVDVKSVEWDYSVRLTVFSSSDLPVSVLPIDLAEEFYNENLGTEILKVPFGDETRLKDFPPLMGRQIELIGITGNESCADIILSSAGWVSVACGPYTCKLRAFTPGGKGCFVRKPALLPYAVTLRGKRIKFTPCYKNDKVPSE